MLEWARSQTLLQKRSVTLGNPATQEETGWWEAPPLPLEGGIHFSRRRTAGWGQVPLGPLSGSLREPCAAYSLGPKWEMKTQQSNRGSETPVKFAWDQEVTLAWLDSGLFFPHLLAPSLVPPLWVPPTPIRCRDRDYYGFVFGRDPFRKGVIFQYMVVKCEKVLIIARNIFLIVEGPLKRLVFLKDSVL